MQRKITSRETLEAAVADVVRLRIEHTQATAAKDADVAEIEKQHQVKIVSLNDDITDIETRIQEYCIENRKKLFIDSKSRETALAVYGFELSPFHVETAPRFTWKEVVKRLLRLKWARTYVRQAEPKPDKNALLANREKLTPKQLTAIGIRFEQDEQFYIRPKPESVK